MAGISKVNPAATTTDVEMVGKDLTFLTVDYINAVNGSAGPAGVQQAVLNLLANRGTVVAIGPLLDSNTQQTFALEGSFTTLGIYSALDGTSGLTLAAALEDDVRNLGTYDGVDVSSATVRLTKLGILTAAVVS